MTECFIVARTRLLHVVLSLSICLAAFASTVSAQARNATGAILRVTVTDPSGAVIIGARVTVPGIEPATRSQQIVPVQTSDAGIAVVTGLLPGRYAVDAEFPGFQKRTVPDLRL